MAAPLPVLTVAVEKGPREGETRSCRPGAALRVGRVVKGNDLAVRDTGASQQHLAIEFLQPPAARWAVSDLGSSNGTLLNGAPLAPAVPALLSHGDLIKVGNSTVLAVSIAPDSNPEPCPGRHSSRHAAAVGPVVEEEEMPVVTRRGTRKKAAAAAEASDAEKGELDAAAVVVEKLRVVPVVVEEEMPPAVTRRGTRKKAAAAASDAEKGELEAAAVVAEEKPGTVTRRGGRKKAAAQELPGEIDESAVAAGRGVQKKAAEPLEPEKDEREKEEATVVTRRGRQKKAVDPPVPEKEEEDDAPVVTRRGGRKKDAATVAPPPMPPKTRSARGRARVTRAVAGNTVLEEEDEEEQGGNELAAPTGNPSTSTAGNVATGDGEAQGTAKALEEEVPKGRASPQRAAFDNEASAAAAEPHEEMEKAAEAMHHGGRKKAIKPPELEKEDDAVEVACQGVRKKATVVTRRGGRKEDAATIVPPPLPAKTRSGRGRGRVTRASAMNTVLEEDTGEEQGENEVATTRERTGNPPSLPAVNGGEEKGDNIASANGEAQGTMKALDEEVPKGRVSAQRAASENGAVAELPEEMVKAKAAIMTHRGGRKKAAVVTRRGGRKKGAATIAPMPPPAKTRSERGRGRVTRATGRNTVREEDSEEEQEENEVVAPREQTRKLTSATAVNVSQEQKGDNVVAGDGEAQGAVKALEEEVLKGRASAQCAAFGNGGEEEEGDARCSSRADSGSNGIPNTTSKYREDRKLKAHSTPFDVRLDRALKKYSA